MILLHAYSRWCQHRNLKVRHPSSVSLNLSLTKTVDAEATHAMLIRYINVKEGKLSHAHMLRPSIDSSIQRLNISSTRSRTNR